MDKICGGELILLSGDGEDGEGMSSPFFGICTRCGETDFYTVKAFNEKGCHMHESTEPNRLILTLDEEKNTIIDGLGDVVLDGDKVKVSKEVIKHIFELYQRLQLIAITEHLIEEYMDSTSYSEDIKDDVRHAFIHFIYN